MENTQKNIVEILTMIAEELQDDAWKRVERGRKKFIENPEDRWLDYDQGVIHGMDEGAQRIYNYIESIKKSEIS